MSIIKKIIIFLTLTVLSSNQLFALEVEQIGKYKDWEVLVAYEPGGKVCFAQSTPVLQAPKSNKRDAKLFVTFRPEENISNEVSVTPGYEFNNKNSYIIQKNKKIKLKEKPEVLIEKIIEDFKFVTPKNLPKICSLISGYFSYDSIRYIE